MYTFVPPVPSSTDAAQGTVSVYELNDVLYELNTEQGIPPMTTSPDTITESFYEGIMNPMYNFQSPYIAQEYSSNSEKEQNQLKYDDLRVENDGGKSTMKNEQFIYRTPYNTKDITHVPGPYDAIYPYSDHFRAYSMPDIGFSPNGLCQYPWFNGDAATPLQHNVTIDPVEHSMNTTRGHDMHDNGNIGARSTFTSMSTPSVISDGSPILQPETPYHSTGRTASCSGNQDTVHDENAVKVISEAIKGTYNGENHNYSAFAQNEADVYNQTYTDTTLEGDNKQSEYWYHTWKHGDNQHYMNVPTFNGGKEYLFQRHPLAQAPPYVMSQGSFPGNVVYNVDGALTKAYIYDNDMFNGYPVAPDETSYYNPSVEYIAMKDNELLDEPIHKMNLIPSVSIGEQPPSAHITQGYDGSYHQSPRREGLYSPQQVHQSSPGAKIPSEEYDEDLLEISVDKKDGGTSKISMETLKNINRNDIDFIRMSDSLWQTLRSTGMFKLGNKGRAILKSKISKQLKMNPKLRMRALCISGVRRATTRQLFQLAQICGIKSHLK